MEIVCHTKKSTRLGDVGKSTLVHISELSTSTKPMICIVLDPFSVDNEIESYICEFNLADIDRVAVVELKTGKLYFLPIETECTVITDYNFEVNNL